jgi:SpoVK/Ycf46/Vps4 family AAA+-type ATPase
MSRRKPDIEATEPTSSSISSKSDLGTAQHHEDAFNDRRASYNTQPRQVSVAAKLRNPLAGLTEEQVIADVDAWCVEKNLHAHQDVFRKGALIARVGQRDDGFEYVNQLSTEEKDWLRHEITHRWSQPKMLYFLVILCAGSAIVQGMDQTAVNGAQVCALFVTVG